MATEDLSKTYQANLWKIKWSGFFAAFRIFVAIQFIYFQQNGLSFSEIGLVVGAFFIGTLLFEVPSGVFADYFGRKTSIAISSLLFIISFSIFGLGSSFIAFLIANFLQGAAEAFTSGSDEAIIYDSLKETGEEEKYGKYFGAKWSYFMYGAALSSIFASLISGLNLRYTFLFSIVGAVFSLLLALIIREPPLRKRSADTYYYKHLTAAAEYLFSSQYLKVLLVYAIGISFTIQLYFQYIQFMLIDAKIPIQYLGFIYAFFLVYCGIFSQVSYAIEKAFTKKTLLISIVVMLAFALYVVNFQQNLITVSISILIVEMLFGFIGPLFSKYFQTQIDSHNRATLSSLRSFGTSVAVVIFAPLFGLIADNYGYVTMFLFLITVMVSLTMPILYSNKYLK